MQIKRKGINIFIPANYWTTTHTRSSSDETNGNKKTKKTKLRAK